MNRERHIAVRVTSCNGCPFVVSDWACSIASIKYESVEKSYWDETSVPRECPLIDGRTEVRVLAIDEEKHL